MRNESELRDHFVNLSDEELLRLLRTRSLTDSASAVAREELASRGIDFAGALTTPTGTPPSRIFPPLHVLRSLWSALRRALRFPWRAILGVEPLWAVVIFGAFGVVLLFGAVVHALARLVVMRPLLPYALQLGYAGLAIQGLSVGWWGIALWRTAGRTRSSAWRICARLLAALCAVQAVLGPMSGARLLKAYIPTPSASVMDLQIKN